MGQDNGHLETLGQLVCYCTIIMYLVSLYRTMHPLCPLHRNIYSQKSDIQPFISRFSAVLFQFQSMFLSSNRNHSYSLLPSFHYSVRLIIHSLLSIQGRNHNGLPFKSQCITWGSQFMIMANQLFRWYCYTVIIRDTHTCSAISPAQLRLLVSYHIIFKLYLQQIRRLCWSNVQMCKCANVQMCKCRLQFG